MVVEAAQPGLELDGGGRGSGTREGGRVRREKDTLRHRCTGCLPRMFTRVKCPDRRPHAADDGGMFARITRSGAVIALWKRWYRGDGELTDDSAMFAAALAALNLMGATLSVAVARCCRIDEPRERGTYRRARRVAAFALGTFLVLGRRAKPWWMFQLSIALDTLVISVALVATGDPGSVYAFYYLWATLYAVCFFNARQIALQAAWVCTAYAIVARADRRAAGDRADLAMAAADGHAARRGHARTPS